MGDEEGAGEQFNSSEIKREACHFCGGLCHCTKELRTRARQQLFMAYAEGALTTATGQTCADYFAESNARACRLLLRSVHTGNWERQLQAAFEEGWKDPAKDTADLCIFGWMHVNSVLAPWGK